MSDGGFMTMYTLPEKPSLRQLKIQAKELRKAVQRRDREAVERLCRHHPRFARLRSRGRDLGAASLTDVQLVIAREYGFGSWPKLKAAIDGVNVARLDDAVSRGDCSEIRAILKVRPELINVNVAGDNEHKPIHFAVLNRQPEALRLLLQHGANPHRGIYPNRDATTAYVLAQERGYDELVAILDEEGKNRRRAIAAAELTVSPLQEELHRAIERDDRARFEEILTAHPELEEASEGQGHTPLHTAASLHRPRFVERLLKKGSGARRIDVAGKTPLDAAVAGVGEREAENYPRFLEVAELLLDHGAPLSAAAAVALGRKEELRAMLAERLVELADETDWLQGGLLTVAVRHGRREVAQLLLDAGWDVDESTRLQGIERGAYSSGCPLWKAADNQDYGIVEMLLDRGADANALVYASGNALSRAYNRRDERMKELLRPVWGRSRSRDPGALSGHRRGA